MTTLRQRYEKARLNYLDLHEKMNRTVCYNISDHELKYINAVGSLGGVLPIEDTYKYGFQLNKCLICNKYVISDYFGKNEKEITLDFFKDCKFLVSNLKE